MKGFNHIESPEEYEEYFENLLSHPDLIAKINLQNLWRHYFRFYRELKDTDQAKMYNAATFFSMHFSTNNANASIVNDLFKICMGDNCCEMLSPTRAPHVLPLLYEKNLEEYSSILFSEAVPEADRKPTSDPRTLTVYNQTGFEKYVLQTTIPVPNKKGKSLSLNADVPIGYNIHLPEDKVKAIMVTVYGGGQINQDTPIYQPHSVTELEKALLKEGVAQISLNLVDILQLKKYQLEMPDDLHHLLHESINQFFNQIKSNPEQLDPTLSVLKDTPLYLFGASFGGRTAVKHAELFPGTFDGYISFDGALSLEMMAKSDLHGLDVRVRDANVKTLCPTRGIAQIQEPILLLHNMDDNNVNVKVTLDWQQQAKEAGKSDLVHLQIAPKGGRTATRRIETIGHKVPQNEISFNIVADTIAYFTTRSPTLKSVSNWRHHRYKTLANKHYRSAKLNEIFISHIYGLEPKERQALLSDEKRFAELYITFLHIETMRNNKQNNLTIKQATHEELKKGFAIHAKNLESFFKDKYPEIATDQINLNDNAFIEKYRAALQGQLKMSREVQSKLLLSFYMGNPELLQRQFESYKTEEYTQQSIVSIKAKLEKKIGKDRKHILSVWKEAGKQAVKLSKVTQDKGPHSPRRRDKPA